MSISRLRAAASSSIITPILRRTFSSSSTAAAVPSTTTTMTNSFLTGDVSSQTGRCIPLSKMRIGTIIHSLEIRPGQGAKFVRAPGTSAKILKEPSASKYVLIRLPSGTEKLINSGCRAVIGSVPGPRQVKKMRKAGENRWRGRRPKVRGVAKNPVDHPHGGGEGKSKGRCSVTPWGKPTKGGYKTASPKKKKRLYVH